MECHSKRLMAEKRIIKIMCYCSPNIRTPVCENCPEDRKKEWEMPKNNKRCQVNKYDELRNYGEIFDCDDRRIRAISKTVKSLERKKYQNERTALILIFEEQEPNEIIGGISINKEKAFQLISILEKFIAHCDED